MKLKGVVIETPKGDIMSLETTDLFKAECHLTYLLNHEEEAFLLFEEEE
ncbi:MAG: hypothetical protein ACO2ZP_04915 [Bacteriovoracaceae bacterium]